MTRVLILAVEYLEPEWQQTYDCLLQQQQLARQAGIDCDLKTIHRAEKGWGSLAEAYNRGFVQHHGQRYDYVWMVTNVTIARVHDASGSAIALWVNAMQRNEHMAAIHPVFNSDHAHLQPKEGAGIVPVPYVEFTAPFVRASVFTRVQLDVAMPYWGHDLDWSYRVAEYGWELYADHDVVLGHEYIRNARKNKCLHMITRRRLMARRRADKATEEVLIKKYGAAWRSVLKYV